MTFPWTGLNPATPFYNEGGRGRLDDLDRVVATVQFLAALKIVGGAATWPACQQPRRAIAVSPRGPEIP
jgi:hypothetical protein